ncbi:WYL domain-containing protein [Arvimicrobium flavum]|uniref:WYL domain-containing protein n=1 Tax=Arvimicrobium flavum TaxID=3393320 RepID=UPI00237C11C1|nr:WYL domain-containing protein [Mesorhizobium shangrilense]
MTTDLHTETISAAIRDRRTLSFVYDGKRRTADPYILGYDGKGVLVLSAVQLTGGSGSGFRTFRVDKLWEVKATDRHFAGRHPDYNPHDAYIERVLAKV